jgi:hypothetical protein
LTGGIEAGKIQYIVRKNYTNTKHEGDNKMSAKITAQPLAKRPLKRVEVDLLESELRQLVELEAELNISRKQLIRYSLALFGWAAKEVRAGKSFGTFDTEAKVAKEVLIPGLSELSATPRPM